MPSQHSNNFQSPIINNSNLILEIKTTVKNDPSHLNSFFDQYPSNPKKEIDKSQLPIQEPNIIGFKKLDKENEKKLNNLNKLEDLKKEFVNMMNLNDKKKIEDKNTNNSSSKNIGYSNINNKLRKNKSFQKAISNYSITEVSLNRSLFKNECVKDRIKNFKIKFEKDDLTEKTQRNQSTLLKNYNSNNSLYSQKRNNKNLIKNTIKSTPFLLDNSLISSDSYKQKSSNLVTETKEITLYEDSSYLIDQVNSLSTKIKKFTQRDVQKLPIR